MVMGRSPITARGLRAAWARVVTATWPICSAVVPKRCMWRCRTMA